MAFWALCAKPETDLVYEQVLPIRVGRRWWGHQTAFYKRVTSLPDQDPAPQRNKVTIPGQPEFTSDPNPSRMDRYKAINICNYIPFPQQP